MLHSLSFCSQKPKNICGKGTVRRGRSGAGWRGGFVTRYASLHAEATSVHAEATSVHLAGAWPGALPKLTTPLHTHGAGLFFLKAYNRIKSCIQPNSILFTDGTLKIAFLGGTSIKNW